MWTRRYYIGWRAKSGDCEKWWVARGTWIRFHLSVRRKEEIISEIEFDPKLKLERRLWAHRSLNCEFELLTSLTNNHEICNKNIRRCVCVDFKPSNCVYEATIHHDISECLGQVNSLSPYFYTFFSLSLFLRPLQTPIQYVLKHETMRHLFFIWMLE